MSNEQNETNFAKGKDGIIKDEHAKAEEIRQSFKNGIQQEKQNGRAPRIYATVICARERGESKSRAE